MYKIIFFWPGTHLYTYNSFLSPLPTFKMPDLEKIDTPYSLGIVRWNLVRVECLTSLTSLINWSSYKTWMLH